MNQSSIAEPTAHSAGTGHADASRSGIPAREFLTFRLGQEEYGIDILKVQEIRGYEQPTRIAGSPSFIKGVVNLRGVIVPIIDLRIKLGLSDIEYNMFTVVVILNVGQRVVGVVVDSVSDVLEIPKSEIRTAPEFSSGIDSGNILGLASIGDRMTILIDIEQMVLAPDMALVG